MGKKEGTGARSAKGCPSPKKEKPIIDGLQAKNKQTIGFLNEVPTTIQLINAGSHVLIQSFFLSFIMNFFLII